MAGFADLLGSLVQNGLSQSGTGRLANAFGVDNSGSLGDIINNVGSMLSGGGQAQASGGGLGGLLGGLLGGGNAASPVDQSGTAGLGGMLGNVLGGLANNSSALGGLGALGGALLGGGGASVRGALGGGALAMLASLAFSALKQAGQAPEQMSPALLGAQTPQHQQQLEDDANVIVRAMISAAKADGAIDQQELHKIIGKLEEGGMQQEEKDFFMQESSKPLGLQEVVTSAGGRQDLAAQIYAASLLAIEVDSQQEVAYLQSLAAGLGLNAEAVAYIEKSLGVQVG